MWDQKRTHREVKDPQISSRYLADYMAASEKARRTLIRNCKYQSIARVVQHDEAKRSIAKFLSTGSENIGELQNKSDSLRERLADTDFERDLYDHNADYIERFIKVAGSLALPDAECLEAGDIAPIMLSGVKVNVEAHCRFRRTTKTNKIRIGLGALRYSKAKKLQPEVGAWQSAFLNGYLTATNPDIQAEPEKKLCVTIDAQSGAIYAAPTDSVNRFNNMLAALETIAERWPKVAPPTNAVL